jgi:hypothetical protein
MEPKCGGHLLDRHEPPFNRRFVVYFRTALYNTVRGFMAGAMKKAGYAVESFSPEGGERSYRINR